MSRPGPSASEEAELFTPNTILGSRWKILRRLGKGGYGEIYSCIDQTNGEVCALKCEKVGKSGSLMGEVAILKVLLGCKYTPHILSMGHHEMNGTRLTYFTMELLGDNLSTLRRLAPAHVFGIATTMALGMQMLRALKAVHCAGFVHRDLKPTNFVLGKEGTSMARKVILIDFGLSKRHLLEDGTARPKRSSARWVGSRRYMSPNTHVRKEQGRRDDLISLMYVLVEFATGTLPWAHLRGLSNLDRVRDLKLTTSDDTLFLGLPDEFRQIMTHIRSLEYEDRPDYKLLHNMMKNCYTKAGGTDSMLMDWERSASSTTPKLHLEMSATESVCIYKSGLAGELEGSSSSDTQSTEEPVTSENATPKEDHRVIVSAEKDADVDGAAGHPKVVSDVISAGSAGTKASSKEKKKKRRCVIM